MLNCLLLYLSFCRRLFSLKHDRDVNVPFESLVTECLLSDLLPCDVAITLPCFLFLHGTYAYAVSVNGLKFFMTLSKTKLNDTQASHF